jgi:hypothetical protein
MKHGYIVNPIPYVLLYLIGVQESQLHSPDNLPQNIKSVGNPESTMKRRRRIPRLGRMRVARARCTLACPCGAGSWSRRTFTRIWCVYFSVVILSIGLAAYTGKF